MKDIIKNLDMEGCLQVLGKNFIGRLGFISWGSPQIIPITYYHDANEKCIISYSSEGHKIDAMRRHRSVSFQVDEINTIQHWKSVLIHGNYEELEGSTAKKYLHRFADGVQDTIAQKEGKTPRFIGDFSSRLSQRKIPIVYRIHITDIVGKYRVS
jgi:nitroimidazol reductase NimA-like FMN-containing flavoprotein (pyridoxamine 5'-phosphate oxidase superfamily)